MASLEGTQEAWAKLVADRKAKTVNDTEGRKRLAEIVAGLKESNDLVIAVNGKASEDLNNYTQAYEKDLQQVGRGDRGHCRYHPGGGPGEERQIDQQSRDQASVTAQGADRSGDHRENHPDRQGQAGREQASGQRR